jgi:hypothetical protein
MKKRLTEGKQLHNFISSSGSGTVINYGSGSGSDFSTSYGSGSGSTSQKVTVPTVPVPVPVSVPVPQHCKDVLATIDEKTWKNHDKPSVFKVNSRSI